MTSELAGAGLASSARGLASVGWRYARLKSQPENSFAGMVPDQEIAVIPTFELESGDVMRNVPVAYKTFGSLAPDGKNVIVVCHAFTGNSSATEWWSSLFGGAGRAFDLRRYFVVCMNCLGSPYGTASPVTNRDGDPSLGLYGPEFPLTTIRDDVGLFRLVLDDLGVKQVAAVVGGSMGGMVTLEFAYFGPDYVRTIAPIATCARHSAWCISWGEAQRQSIYGDLKYMDGYYPADDPPVVGLSAARMVAMLTYRSRDSFEKRFGRNVAQHSSQPEELPPSPRREAWEIHNDGHKRAGRFQQSRTGSEDGSAAPSVQPESPSAAVSSDGVAGEAGKKPTPTPTYFSANSYLRYQGDKFIRRFDANCYISLTRKLDTHDVSRGRAEDVKGALGMIEQPAVVLGIPTDGLFFYSEQEELARMIPGAYLRTVESRDGHDGFLLEFEQVNQYLLEFFEKNLPEFYSDGLLLGGEPADVDIKPVEDSIFGATEGNLTAW